MFTTESTGKFAADPRVSEASVQGTGKRGGTPTSRQDISKIGARGSTLALPAEVWLKIAEHMKIDEWARASGTCKAAWQLQLDVVRIGVDHLPDTGGGCCT
ncbi:hypothetical protein COCOBI_08-1660 [Coccomyxa sp. Obi]|nr:hypothetical protein COCOBI_08-1660 [Coccomyxa sp. Obi]